MLDGYRAGVRPIASEQKSMRLAWLHSGTTLMSLAHLDAAAHSRFLAGNSIEVLLELLAVRARMKIDAALLCTVAVEGAAVGLAPARIVGLIDYLNHGSTGRLIDPAGPDEPARPAAEALVKRAKATTETFYRYATSWGVHHPYFAFGTFLSGWCKVVESRLSVRAETRQRLLTEGMEFVERAHRHMDEGEYGMHLSEADTLCRSLSRIVQRPMKAARSRDNAVPDDEQSG
jgi:hypothetical protein